MELYRSPLLEKVWTLGHSSVGNVTFESASYVARYVMKKVTGSKADLSYLDAKTGVLRLPEFTVMSRRPGIGNDWYNKFKSDCYPVGKKVVRGLEVRTPRYYDNLYEAEDPEGFEELKKRRRESVDFADSVMARLRVKEECALARVERFGRNLEKEIYQ